MSEKLKPCPFCEKQHEWTKAYSHYGVVEFIQCGKFIMFEHGITEKVRKDKAIELYNTRPIEDQLRAENERLMETINLLQNWTKAYPLDMFPEPDLKLAQKLLTDGGVSYDALNAYSMRHVINGVGKIIDEALNEVGNGNL